MPEITLTIVPGADDILIDNVSLNDIDSLRSECLSEESVSCDWETLNTRLINHDVSRCWWILTEKERRSIAEMAIENTIYRIAWYYRKGEHGEWDKLSSPCAYNATIRFQKFGTPIGWWDCYWKYDSSSSEVFSYAPSEYYGLPVVNVNIASHVMCGLQVVNSVDKLSNWVVFQYASHDIKPGSAQLPYGKHVLIQDPFPYYDASCISFDSNIIAEFDV